MTPSAQQTPIDKEPLAQKARRTPVTHRRVLAIAAPMTLAYLSTPLVGLVDVTVIGRLGDAALLGGIAIGAVIFDLLFTSFNFLRASTTGLTAQEKGAGNKAEQAAILYRALLIALSAGLVICLLSPVIVSVGVWVMGAEGKVADAAGLYVAVRLLATPFALANYALLGWFIGRGQSGITLLLQTILNGSNIAFSVLFVTVLDWGVAGAAYGSLAGEAIAAFVGLALALAALRGRYAFYLPPLLRRIFRRDALRRMVALNRDIMIRSLCLLFAFAFFTAQGNQFGAVTLAANAVLMNFLIFGAYFLDGLATAAEQLAGEAVGARSRHDFDRSLTVSLQWALLLGAAASAVIWFGGGPLIRLVTTAPEVQEAAKTYLFWAAIGPVLGALAFQMDGIFIGATWSREMRNMMLLSLALYLIIWALAVPSLENHGLWLALLVFFSARGLSLSVRVPSQRRGTFDAKGA